MIKKPVPLRSRLFYENTLARTYFPADGARSIMGALGLNFRVRDGNGCCPQAMCAKEIFSAKIIFL